MNDPATDFQKMYASEIHLDIGRVWDGGIDVSIGGEEYATHVRTVAEALPWLQKAIAEHYPDSKYNVERLGGTFVPTWFGPEEHHVH